MNLFPDNLPSWLKLKIVNISSEVVFRRPYRNYIIRYIGHYAALLMATPDLQGGSVWK
jgi:hypothetical protein